MVSATNRSSIFDGLDESPRSARHINERDLRAVESGLKRRGAIGGRKRRFLASRRRTFPAYLLFTATSFELPRVERQDDFRGCPFSLAHPRKSSLPLSTFLDIVPARNLLPP